MLTAPSPAACTLALAHATAPMEIPARAAARDAAEAYARDADNIAINAANDASDRDGIWTRLREGAPASPAACLRHVADGWRRHAARAQDAALAANGGTEAEVSRERANIYRLGAAAMDRAAARAELDAAAIADALDA